MHRFGRSAQKKMNDRWGGLFLVAVLVAVLGAWKAGDYLSNVGNGNQAANRQGTNGLSAQNGAMLTQAHEFQIHFVQVGAFRSEGAARNLSKNLSEAGFTAMVAPKNQQGLVKVYTGPFMNPNDATNAKSQLTSDGLVQGAFNVTMTVDYKPDAVMAMTGSANSDLQKGLDALNAYLYEASNWFAGRATGQPADGVKIASLGQEMSQYIGLMGKADANPAVASFIALATSAGENAAAVDKAATALPGTDDFQVALNGYLSLLDQYHSFHIQGAGN